MYIADGGHRPYHRLIFQFQIQMNRFRQYRMLGTKGDCGYFCHLKSILLCIFMYRSINAKAAPKIDLHRPFGMDGAGQIVPGGLLGQMVEMAAVVHLRRNETDVQTEEVMDFISQTKAYQ